MNEPLLRLFSYLPPYKLFIGLSLIAMIISAAASSLMALLLGEMTDLGFYQKNGIVAIWAPIALIGVSMLHSGGQFVSAYLLQKVSQAVLVIIRNQLFDRMLRWPDETVQKLQSGVVVSKFINEASMALGSASEVLTVMVRDSLQVVALLAVLLWHNWQLTLVTFVVAPFLLIVLRYVSKRMKVIQTKTQGTYGQMLGFLTEVFQAQRLVKIYNGYLFEELRFGHVNRKLQGLAIRAKIAEGLGTPTTQLITMSGVAIVVFVALIQAQADMLSFPEFVTYMSAMLLMTPAIKKLSALNGTTARMSAAATSLFEMMDIPIEKDPGKKDIGRVEGNVEFKNISYRYPDVERTALKNFNLKVEKGQMIA
ncbi:MAG: ABC transporter ATP-binding protein, partial [Burkholderiales bacterium]|nr:ABC transporter ATP-binding protein [Burkholderiales bacterium]